MTTAESIGKLQPGACYILSAPKVQMILTGVADARISHDGRIRLTYEDGTVELGRASQKILDTDMDDHSLFEWVTCVQEQRQSS